MGSPFSATGEDAPLRARRLRGARPATGAPCRGLSVLWGEQQRGKPGLRRLDAERRRRRVGGRVLFTTPDDSRSTKPSSGTGTGGFVDVRRQGRGSDDQTHGAASTR